MIHKKLDCGVTLVADALSCFRSATVGIWAQAGSVTETAADNGISHLIEHMLFKGTAKRSAKQIAVDVDRIGGQINAFTSKENTCYYIKVMDEKLAEGIEILTDLFCAPTLPPDELEREKGVVLEEIAMSNDQPDDVVMDLVAAHFFAGCSLERTILGPPDNIRRFTRSDLENYMDRRYTADNVVVAVAGNFDEHRLTEALEKGLAGVRRGGRNPDYRALEERTYAASASFQPKDIEQVQVCVALPCCSYSDRTARHALSVVSNVLGGSMSSRLFQSIREERGLAYSVYSHPMLYRDTGMFTIYAGTMPQNTQQVTELIMQELRRMREHGITPDELTQSKEMLKGSLILSLESSSSRMSALARSMLAEGRPYTEEEMIAAIDAVDMEAVARQIEETIDPDRVTGAYVGPVPNEQNLRSMLERTA
ncbi:MAG: insulinase family protein [Clostridia bacterium]|nr:insulinase family protein [Clostridia bacterium]